MHTTPATDSLVRVEAGRGCRRALDGLWSKVVRVTEEPCSPEELRTYDNPEYHPPSR